MLNPISDNWIEDGNQPENDTFNDVKTIVKAKIKAGGRPLSYYPVHPSRVKRSLLHWHSMEVTSLCFTSCGAHLLSGGLEGVLLKWDMTECFGGPKKCRFLPHLGSPISSISSYGGFCEDTISVTLENNSFHILNSAFTLVYHKQGFMQLPRRWVQMPEFLMPKNLFILENHFMRSTGAGVAFGAQTTVSSIPTLVLANGGSGKLQLIDINDDQRNAQKIDITNQNHVVRLNTSKLPVMYSEVLLTAQLASEAEFTWLVTYECLKTSSDKSGLDNQSRLTWWQCRKVDDDIEKDGMKDDANVKAREFAKFTPIDTYSMAHFGCPAVGMGFVPNERKELYVLLADYRLMIWYFNEESKKHPLYSPWIPSSCHLLTCANPFESTMRPISTIITFNVNDNQTVEPLNCLLICSGASLTLFNWEQLVMQSHPNHTANLQLKSNLLELWPDCKKSFIDNCTVVVTAPPPSDCPTDTRCIVVTVRSQGSRSAEGRRLLYSTLCLIKCTPMSLEVASIIPNVHATCMTSHPNKSCIAIGLEDGTVAVYKLQLDSDVKLQLTHNLPSLAAQPFCDRKHKGGVKNREKNKKKSSGTQIISLDFIPSKGHNDVDNDDAKDGQLDKEGIQLVGIMRTTVGRETGRRDLVYYGIRRGQKCSSETEPPPHPSKHSKQGLLQLVDVASPVQFNGRSRPAKRKCDADHQLENTLKQISQYPIYTAPPPDQLLHQLMKKH
uniref:WD_REPEATS_REGION domain-containing protein n=1 Tax=Trichobilharzia regenti TaxID=157069 RepID=A0AA85J7V8_TRIRE|nr:unnamed protein product [Trichobilharzia regenti]